MNTRLQSILELSYSFSAIDRDIYYPGRNKPENDVEHSYQLAFMAWHIIETDKLLLDQAKVFKLCLAHDLVEIYAGDVPLWGKEGHDEKDTREKEALQVLKSKFSDRKEMTDAIVEYKERKTEEAKFVYGLDKLLPFLTQLNTEGRIWKAHDISLERALGKLEVHVQASAYLEKYFLESMEFMKGNKERFFNN